MHTSIDTPISTSILDSHAALDRCAGDPSLLSEIAGLFIKDAPHRLTILRDASRARDTNRLALTAHSLKGSALTFGATRAAHAAECVERFAVSANIEAAVTAAMVLDCEILRLVDALDALVREVDEDTDGPSDA